MMNAIFSLRKRAMKKKAVVLLSGGLDSATVLAMAKTQGFNCYALSVDYGQRHHSELAAALLVSQMLGAREHRVVNIDLTGFGGSALTDSSIAVPEQESTGIPLTYVPARNTIMLSLALAWAEVLHAQDIFIGVNAVDYSGYPDCRPAYIEAFERMAKMEREIGHAINKKEIGKRKTPDYKIIPVYLDELNPKAGNFKKEPDISCGVLCQGATE